MELSVVCAETNLLVVLRVEQYRVCSCGHCRLGQVCFDRSVTVSILVLFSIQFGRYRNDGQECTSRLLGYFTGMLLPRLMFHFLESSRKRFKMYFRTDFSLLLK